MLQDFFENEYPFEDIDISQSDRKYLFYDSISLASNANNSYKCINENESEDINFIENINLSSSKHNVNMITERTRPKNNLDIKNKFEILKSNLFDENCYPIKNTNKSFLNKKHSDKQNIDYNAERKYGIDNFSQKFLKAVNDWILTKLNNKTKKLFGEKFSTPNYKIITHNANRKNLFLYINLKFKNILTFTPKHKQKLDEIRKMKGDKERKMPKIQFNKKEKENLIKLLKKHNKKDLSNINALNDNDINSLKDILIEKKYDVGDVLIAADKINLEKLLINEKIIKEKKNYKLQEHNENLKKKCEQQKELFPELEKKYSQLFGEFLLSKDSFNFKNRKDIIQIDENFKKLKNRHYYSLLEVYEDNKCGFKRMIEEDSGINEFQKKIYNEIFEYFNDKDINEKEIEKYKGIIAG